MAGAGVHLGDLNAVRASHIAHPAAAAIIHGMIGGGLIDLAETGGLGSGIFWPGEDVSYGSNRTSGDANVALDALVEA